MADEPVRLPRPRGRPPLEVKGTSISSWVRPNEYDRLVKMAHQQDKSVSALVRSLLMLRVRA